MNRLASVLFLLSSFAAVSAAGAQATTQSGPAQPPAASPAPERPADNGKCQQAHSGDVVTYFLTIEDVKDARSVAADLQLHNGRGGTYHPGDLPRPGSGTLGGGGIGHRVSADSDVFSFRFTVRADAPPGLYHTLGVAVTLDYGVNSSRPTEARVNRHAREEVRSYCLAVLSGPGTKEPTVTGFQRGDVEPPPAVKK